MTDPSFFLPQPLVVAFPLQQGMGKCLSPYNPLLRLTYSQACFGKGWFLSPRPPPTPAPPAPTHTLQALLLICPWAVSSTGCMVWAGSLRPALLCPLLVEGPTIRVDYVALLCMVGKRPASGDPSWPPIILASIKLKHIAHLLHNKPQLFHGSN